MATTVRELLVKLGFEVDDKKLKSWQQSATEGAKKFATEFTKAAKVVAVGAAAAAVGIFKLVDEATKSGDEIAKGARAIGVTADTYQKLSFMANRSGVEMSVVSVAVRKLGKNLLDASQGGGKLFTDTLGQLGVTMADLEGLAPEAQMGVIADALARVEDPAKRAAMSMNIFGEEGGPKMASLLALGSAGMTELSEEAKRLGLILDKEALAASEDFQDQLGDLKGVIGAVARDLGIALIPTVKEIIVELREWIIQNKALLTQGISEFVRDVARAAKDLLPALVTLVGIAARLASALGPVGAAGAMLAFKAASGGVVGIVVGLGVALGVLGGHLVTLAQTHTARATLGMKLLEMQVANTTNRLAEMAAKADKIAASNRTHEQKMVEGFAPELLRGGKRGDKAERIDRAFDQEAVKKANAAGDAVYQKMLRSGASENDAELRGIEAQSAELRRLQEKRADARAAASAAFLSGGRGGDIRSAIAGSFVEPGKAAAAASGRRGGGARPKADPQQSALELLESEFGDGSGKSFHAGGGGGMDSRPTLGTTINRVTNEYSPKVDVAITAAQRQGESTGEFAERVKSMLSDELEKMHRRGYDHFLGAVVG